MAVIGREKETKALENLYSSNKSELVAVYGRRRVGKTYLIDETFRDRITFRHSGLSPVEEENIHKSTMLKMQLRAFYYSLLNQGMKKSHIPSDWLEAFFMLETYLDEVNDGSRQLVFLDELPWMDSPKSGFITAFESFWNSWGSHRSNLMVVICGSSTAWILDKLINNHDGLYGRVSFQIYLKPFTLKETEEFFISKGLSFSRYDITQAYMIVGGIPYYLNYFQKGMSLAQNIDNLFFTKGAKLLFEFDRLFASIFKNPDDMKKIVSFLSLRRCGYSKKEISENVGLPYGGSLTALLNGLIAGDFITEYKPFGIKKAETYYRVIDPFCLFHLKFLKDKSIFDSNFWLNNINSNSLNAWRGYAFENVCFKCVDEIKKALGISGVSTSESFWSKKPDDLDGTQIDLLISRKDNVVNMCEIKFYDDLFEVDKDYDLKLRHRKALLSELLPKRVAIHSTLITTFGLSSSVYASAFDNVITLDELFS